MIQHKTSLVQNREMASSLLNFTNSICTLWSIILVIYSTLLLSWACLTWNLLYCGPNPISLGFDPYYLPLLIKLTHLKSTLFSNYFSFSWVQNYLTYLKQVLKIAWWDKKWCLETVDQAFKKSQFCLYIFWWKRGNGAF